MHVRAALAAALFLSLAAACSSERESPAASGSGTDDTDADTPDPTTETVTSDPATSEPSTGDSGASDPVITDPPATEVPVADGTTEVESSSLGVRFAVPETYTVLDPTALGDDFYRGAAFEELAARAGLTIEEFERFLKEAVELYVFAPATAEGFVDNITVAAVPTPELPPSEQLEQTLVALGAQELTIEDGSRRGLEYLQSIYELPVGDQVVYGVDLQILVGDTPVEITATSGTRETAEDLGALVLDTVASS